MAQQENQQPSGINSVRIPRLANSLYGKLLLPIVGLMLLSLVVTGLVFNQGISATSRRIFEQEVQSDSQKIIQGLNGRVGTVGAAAAILANNPEIANALHDSSVDSLSTLNSRALTVRDRFELDLVQIYDPAGEERTNLVQSSLYKVSTLYKLLSRPGADLYTVDDRLVYLARQDVPGGGTVIVGIDILSELDRLSFQLGLRDGLSLQPRSLVGEIAAVVDGEYILQTPFLLGAQAVVLVHRRNIDQFNAIADSGRSLILLSTLVTTLVMIGLSALVIGSILRPIRKLAQAAQQLAQADSETVSPELVSVEGLRGSAWIGRNDEMGQLADAFAHMTTELRGIYRGLVRDLREANQELNTAYDSALQGWSSALELRDHDTEKHTQRVTERLVDLARFMGIPEEEIVHYRRGALLHDVGKMAIPDSILRKRGPLSDQEWETMRQHPIFAYVMLRKVPFLQKALDIPYCHHEKWDGTGYPRGLVRTQIPLSARIFSVLDTWDSLEFDRPYRKAWPREKIFEFIASQSDKDFDPAVVDAFFEWMKKEHLLAPGGN